MTARLSSIKKSYLRDTDATPVGVSDKERYLVSVMHKGFRDCVTGRTLDGLLAMTRGDLVVVTLEAVTGPILKTLFAVLLDNTTDAATAGFVKVALDVIVKRDAFAGAGGLTSCDVAERWADEIAV